MKKILTAVMMLGLAGAGIAATTASVDARPVVGIHIGNVGVGVGHYHYHGHYYHHRHFDHGHYRYW